MNKIIKVATKFPYPGSRFIRLGPQSGEEFKNYLFERLVEIYGQDFKSNQNSTILVDLDGTVGYGSSFLEEGFGGLLRMGVPYSIVNSLKIKSNEEPELVEEIDEYIQDEYKKLLKNNKR